jgi:hypothetical protein
MSLSPSDAAPAVPPTRYEIRVEGVLDSRWSAWFDGLQISSDEHGETTIAGPVTDQTALHGLLARVRDLALPLVSVRRTHRSRSSTPLGCMRSGHGPCSSDLTAYS